MAIKKIITLKHTIMNIKTSLLFFTLLLPNVASAQDYAKVDGVAYELTTTRGTDPQPIARVASKDYRFNEPYTGKVVIPASIVYQGKTYPVVGMRRDAFAGSEKLTSVVLPKNIKFISSGAFRQCNLSSYDFLDGITTIGSLAFAECGVKSLTIPKSVMTIEEAAFEDCDKLESITLSPNIIYVEASVFAGCKKLQSVVLPEGIQEIPSKFFSGCTALKEVVIPEFVKTIGNKAFSGCESLTSIVVPDNVTKIYNDAFRRCISLQSLTFGSKVKEISVGVFGECRNLKDIYVNALKSPRISEFAFNGLPCDKITLHVPVAAVETFKGMIPWNKLNIVGDPNLTGMPKDDGSKWEYRTTSQNDDCTIKKVVTTSSETKVYMELRINKSTRCNISPEAYIEANGIKYKIKDAIGITFAPTFASYNAGSSIFSFIFPPLPSNVTKFNMIEEDSSWKFYDVKAK